MKCVSLPAQNFLNPVLIPGQALQFLGLFSLLVHNGNISPRDGQWAAVSAQTGLSDVTAA